MIKFLNNFFVSKRANIDIKGNYSSAEYKHYLETGESFKVNDPEWFFIPSSVDLRNAIVDELTKDGFTDIVSSINSLQTGYNYLLNPNHLFDFIQITKNTNTETIDENNFKSKMQINESGFKSLHGSEFVSFKSELIDRPKNTQFYKSVYAIVKQTNIEEHMIQLQIKEHGYDYVILTSSKYSNLNFYKNTMFKIADTFSLN